MNYKKISLFVLSLLFCSVVIFSTQYDIANATVVKLSNPLGTTTSIQILIGKVIDAVLGVVGSLALLMFIYGGFTWMTASGNEQSVTKGKNILMWAAVGLVVIFLSYALVKFIIKAIGA
jgi:TRAP-type C4-dicarboxylate transport system permease small subunit